MNITEHEMRGLLAGKCLPGDMRVNEELPAYLVRKFAELKTQRDALAAENASMMALAIACEKEFGSYTDEEFPDDAKVSYPEERCNITFGMIRRALNKTATAAHLNSLRAEGADKVAEYHFVRIDALKEVSRQGHLFHKAAYSDAVSVANLFRAGKDGV